MSEETKMEEETNQKCPICGSTELDRAMVQVQEDAAIQHVSCDNCGASWIDCYTWTFRIMVEQ